MNYRTFGSTGISLSEICFGTWRYASPDGKPDERSEAVGAALRRGIDAGINCIHSASEYGTRWLTGQVLGDHPKRKELHHIIKVNEPDFGDERFDAARFRTKVEEALSDLHTDRIAEFDRDVDEFRNEVERLKREGKIASLAGFPYTPRFARHAVASGTYDGLVVGIRPLCAGLLTDKRVDRSRLAEEPASWTQFAIAMSLSHPLVATSTLRGFNT